MSISSRLFPACGLALALLVGCASHKSSGDLKGEESALPNSLPGMSIPLDIREFDVVPAENGVRGVFLKLSRLPSGVTHHAENNPPRIIVDIAGPTGTESAPEIFPANDTLVTNISLARQMNTLQVVVNLDAAEVPPYEVLPMADWILVRIKPQTPPRPWSHRAS